MFLDALPVPIDRVVIGGFSQGAVMSWALGLGAGRPRPAAILALSGFMPEVEGFELDLAGLAGYPIAVAHGSLDPVIPVEFGRAAAERVREAGAELLWRETPVPHTIDPRLLPELQAFVAAVTFALIGRPGSDAALGLDPAAAPRRRAPRSRARSARRRPR